MPADMEAVLLSTQEVKDFAKDRIICISTNRGVPKGYDVPYPQFCWVFTFNKAGELTDTWSDKYLNQTHKNIEDKLGGKKFAQLMTRSLSKKSLQELEREYLDSKGSDAAYQALSNKIIEMQTNRHRTARLFRKMANDKNASEEVREASRIRAFLMLAAVTHRQVINTTHNDAVYKEARELVMLYPGHPEALNIVAWFFKVGCLYKFDIPAKCAETIKEWESSELAAEKRKAMTYCVNKLNELRKDWQKQAEIDLANEKYSLQDPAVALGRADIVVRVYENRERRWYGLMRRMIPVWYKEAKEKLEKDIGKRKEF
ncbi:hypothetical protein ACFLS1_01190 [Verrucomicrobiota bacterium]